MFGVSMLLLQNLSLTNLWSLSDHHASYLFSIFNSWNHVVTLNSFFQIFKLNLFNFVSFKLFLDEGSHFITLLLVVNFSLLFIDQSSIDFDCSVFNNSLFLFLWLSRKKSLILYLNRLVFVCSIGHCNEGEEEEQSEPRFSNWNLLVKEADEHPNVSKKGGGSGNTENTHVIDFLDSQWDSVISIWISVSFFGHSIDGHCTNDKQIEGCGSNDCTRTKFSWACS